MVSNSQSEGEESSFVEFRRKVRAAESALVRHGAAVAAAPVHWPGQRGDAEWPRAEIRLGGGLFSPAVL